MMDGVGIAEQSQIQLTGSSVEDEIPHPGPSKTGMTTWKTPESFLQLVSLGTGRPARQSMYRVFRECFRKLASIEKVGSRSTGRDLFVSALGIYERVDRLTLMIFVNVMVRPRLSRKPSIPECTSHTDFLTKALSYKLRSCKRWDERRHTR